MKIRLQGNGETRDVYLNGEFLDPSESQKVFNHSPDGFSWGYSGSGPSQLALSILLRLTSKAIALKNYQSFKRDIIAALPCANSFVEEIEIGQYLL